MLRSVSWFQFIQTLLILLAIYYPAILLLYFRRDMLKWLTLGIALVKPVPGKAQSEISNQGANKSPDQMQPAVHDLMNDLQLLFKNADSKKTKKPELIIALQNKLRQFPELKDSPLKDDISKYIGFKCGDHCGMEFSEEELNMLWKA